jgi:acetyl-CoA acetyltransferase
MMTSDRERVEVADRYGLQTMCEAGGTANATVIERL